MDKIILRRKQFLQSFKDFLRRVVFDDGVLEAPVYLNKLLNTIQNASILQIPVTFGLGKLYSQFGEDFDVVRNSTVIRTNENGYHDEVAINTPVIDYADGFPVLLRQPQGTNFLIDNTDIENGGFSRNGYDVTNNELLSPDNLMNGALMVNTGGASSNYVRSNINFTSTELLQTVCFSYYFKYVNTQWAFLRSLAFTGATSGGQCYFDVLNGVIGANSFPTNSTVKMTPVANGWYRVSITQEIAPLTDASGLFQIGAVNSDGSNLTSIGNSVGLYLPQAEEGATPSSPIITGNTPVTRLKDELTATISTNSINTEEGAFYVERANLVIKNGNAIRITDGSANQNYLSLLNFASGRLVAQYRSNGVVDSIGFPINTSIDILEYYSMLLLWDEENISLYVNEIFISTTPITYGFTPNSLNTIEIKNVEAKIKDLRVYKSIAEAKLDLPYIS